MENNLYTAQVFNLSGEKVLIRTNCQNINGHSKKLPEGVYLVSYTDTLGRIIKTERLVRKNYQITPEV